MVGGAVGPRSALRNWDLFWPRRILRLLVSLFALVTITFFMVQLVPGNPVREALGPDAPAKVVAQREKELGLDKPLLVQYVDYWDNALHGNLGTSLAENLPVTSIIESRIWRTASLLGLALAFTIVVSLPMGLLLGVLTDNGRRRRLEVGFTSIASTLNSIPEFLFAIGLVFLFGVALQWLPVAGAGGLNSYALPTLAIALGPTAALTRIVRVETTTVLKRDYMLVARSKRLPARILYLRHALPNLLTAALTVGGLLLTVLVGSVVIVENVFAWPGLGTELVQAITSRDFPLVQGIMLVLGATVLLINLLVDVLIALVDPRSTIRETG
ncbi:MAG: ABC transporter permease [Candidatus Dormiibacterota bacterium]